MNWIMEYEKWLASPVVDEATKNELLKIKDNEAEIKERFYKNLEFGTAGLRGIIGAGTNRMNIYTVRKATQGICADVINCGEQSKGVVISYDSRRMSKEFAFETAKVLSANGIKSYLFDELRPVPELSFAVRHLNASRGVMITASHNPKEYNGYKVYGCDGCQLPPESADYVTSIFENIDIFDGVKIQDSKEELINIIGCEIDNAYLNAVKDQSVNEGNYNLLGDNFKVVYSPFNGAGNKLVRKILDMTGLKNVFVVPEQEKPDPEFSTLKSPNPEEKEGFELAIKLAEKENADLVFATDPDCDRIGVMAKNGDDYIALNGNQLGVLLTEFILRNKKEKGTLCDNGAIIKTIVSTSMVYPIAGEYGVKVYDVLTGFKFIGEKIKDFEENDFYNQFIFGFEESYGYLSGTHARDKDAVVAAMLTCQMAAEYKKKGMSLYDGLMSLYEKYGYYLELTTTKTFSGIDGAEKIKNIMEGFRKNPISEINGIEVSEMWDVKESMVLKRDNTKEELSLPKSDVLKYIFDDKSWFAVRPSGTEPKIKLYFGVCGQSLQSAQEHLKKFSEKILKMM